MPFDRLPAPQWHENVPGSRWFRADLHVHTVDDLPGRRIGLPPSVSGDPADPKILQEYARAVLRSAVRVGVQVLGLTPHAVRVGTESDTSAVWHIVDVWNSEADDDGVPFREKLYSVFPGFEPNVNDGGSGVHLLFLFDPEIGRDRYLALFHAVMDGRSPWKNGNLQMTSRDFRGILRTIDDRRKEDRCSWDYLILAPHFQNRNGLLGEVKRQVLEEFPCERLAGYELANHKLPSDFTTEEKPGLFLLPFMEKNRQAFFHGSDAYSLPATDSSQEHELGYRTTWIKLASPRIEALRQAFVANQCRLRIGYEREGDGLSVVTQPPDALRGSRPWLRSVSISGEAAFFGGAGSDGRKSTTVMLSPDLTCIIGGSMTGKSTFLDGIRVLTGADLPSDERLRSDVIARARERFLAGQPDVHLDTPGRVVGPPSDRWPAVFFTQNELQRLAQDPGAVKEILARLVPERPSAILECDRRMGELDADLRQQARSIEELLDRSAEAEQELVASEKAAKALDAFRAAGMQSLRKAQELRSVVSDAWDEAEALKRTIEQSKSRMLSGAISEGQEVEINACIKRNLTDADGAQVRTMEAAAQEAIESAVNAVDGWQSTLASVTRSLDQAVIEEQQAVEKRLAELGHGAEKLAEFQTLSSLASEETSRRSEFEDVQEALTEAKAAFERDHGERSRLIVEQREAFDRVKNAVKEQFAGRIRVRRIDHGNSATLAAFLQAFRQKGITQWWNGLEQRSKPSPETIYKKLVSGDLDDLGVSQIVSERFDEVFTEACRYELRAIRSPDQFALELQVGDGEYREASKLSGGRKVSVLLSLLLEAHDERPLIIDQPEDELDNRFMWRTVLPALQRLKGRRQVVVATHDANVVVNGDAELVVLLEADSQHGQVAVSGAIEDPKVRRAIIDTVDGGEDAFELRQAKYGF